MRVALATCAGIPDLEPDDRLLLAALAAHGIDGVPAVWDDDKVDWDAFDLVVLRSTWDYAERRDEFLAWMRSLRRVLNSAPLVEWNTDKRYLFDLEVGGCRSSRPDSSRRVRRSSLRRSRSSSNRRSLREAAPRRGSGPTRQKQRGRSSPASMRTAGARWCNPSSAMLRKKRSSTSTAGTRTRCGGGCRCLPPVSAPSSISTKSSRPRMRRQRSAGRRRPHSPAYPETRCTRASTCSAVQY